MFIDGFMDTQARGDVDFWLKTCSASYLIFTTRRTGAADAIETALGLKPCVVELDGLDEAAFTASILLCQKLKGCDAIELSLDYISELFWRTGGSPLATKLAITSFSSSKRPDGKLIHPAELGPAEAIESLVLEWKQDILVDDGDTHAVLSVLATISSIGMSKAAIAFCLSWLDDRVGTVLLKLLDQGFVSLVSPHDFAYCAHDSMRKAFASGQIGGSSIPRIRRRHLEYANRGSDRSPISRLDGLIALSEHVFSELKDSNEETLEFVDVYAVYLSLHKLQKIISQSQFGTAADASKFADWLAEYLGKNRSILQCNEVIAIGGLACLMPEAYPAIGEAFAQFWEPGTERDPTKVTAALPASIRHWEAALRLRPDLIMKRVVDAIFEQKWNRFDGTPELVAAAFAAALARLGQACSETYPGQVGCLAGRLREDGSDQVPRGLIASTSLASAFLSGFMIRYSGISHVEGFAATLLTLHEIGNHEIIDQFQHYHGGFCRDIDQVTTVFLRGHGIICSSRHGPAYVDLNLNRNMLLASWSGNSHYFNFVERIMTDSKTEMRGTRPPTFRLPAYRLTEILSDCCNEARCR